MQNPVRVPLIVALALVALGWTSQDAPASSARPQDTLRQPSSTSLDDVERIVSSRLSETDALAALTRLADEHGLRTSTWRERWKARGLELEAVRHIVTIERADVVVARTVDLAALPEVWSVLELDVPLPERIRRGRFARVLDERGLRTDWPPARDEDDGLAILVGLSRDRLAALVWPDALFLVMPGERWPDLDHEGRQRRARELVRSGELIGLEEAEAYAVLGAPGARNHLLAYALPEAPFSWERHWYRSTFDAGTPAQLLLWVDERGVVSAAHDDANGVPEAERVPFVPGHWREEPACRAAMASGLVEQRRLVGVPMETVGFLLGAPDHRRLEWRFHIGAVRTGLFSSDAEWLVLTFDVAQDPPVVERVEIVTQ